MTFAYPIRNYLNESKRLSERIEETKGTGEIFLLYNLEVSKIVRIFATEIEYLVNGYIHKCRQYRIPTCSK